MNNKQLQPIAMFMICLIITLPIYVSSVYADINNVRAYGENGIDNFIKQQYDLTIEAGITGDTTSNKIKLTHSSGLATNFDSCSGTGNDSSLCSVNLVYGQNSAVELCPSSTFSIEQFESVPGNLIDSKTIKIKCDAKPPISTISVSPESSTGEDVTLTYNIIDPRDAITECSGIDKIEFYLNNLNSPATIETNSSTCTYSGSTTISASSYNDGEVVVFLKAYDKLGQSSVTNTSFYVDKSGPDGEATVELTDLHGTPIEYFQPQTVLANVVLTISDLTGISTYELDYSQLTSASPHCGYQGRDIVCSWSSIQINMNEPSFTRTIKLDADDDLGNTASRDILVQGVLIQDSTPPLIIMSDITIDTIDGSTIDWFKPGQMKMSFNAEVSEDISGIKSISPDLSNIDVIRGKTPVCAGNEKRYTCSWSSVIFNMDTASFSQEIKIIAKDYAGNEKIESKTASANYRADNIPPSISNFEIVDSYGTEITDWIGDEQVPAKIYVDVTEKGSGLNTIKGNFRSINPAYPRPIEGDCIQLSGPSQQQTLYQEVGEDGLPEYEYQCEWDVIMDFDTSGNPLTAQFKFNATDNSLNPSTPSFTKDFKVDIDGPVATNLRTDNIFGGVYYVGKDSNKFISRIADSGIGLVKSKVYLDLSSLGLRGLKQADNCSGDYCYWEIPDTISTSEGSHDISISTKTTDNIGNSIEDKFELEVVVDTTPPVVDYVEITPAKASKEVFRDLIQIGNALSIVANITEANSLFSATADLSSFISDETEDLADNCERQINDQGRETDKWICKWATDEIDITGYKIDDISLTFTDVAGNTEVSSHEIEVLEEIEEEVDYWKNSVRDGSPNAIDKQIITRYQPSMVFPVDLNKKRSSDVIWPIDVFVDNCLTTVTDSAGTPTITYLSSDAGNLPVLVDHNTDSSTGLPYNIYLNYILDQASPPDNSIDITCQLKIRTLVDKTKISPYEYENITVTIDYYNNPLGEMSSDIQEEIDRVKSGWLVQQKYIDPINSVIDISRSICRTFQLGHRVVTLIAVATGKLSLACAVDPTRASCEAQQAAANTGEAIKNTETGFWDKYGKKFCALTGCTMWNTNWAGGEGIINEVGKSLTKLQTKSWIGIPSTVENINTKRRIGMWNMENSLILSIAFICIPGIAHNLQKARVIDCQYIRCLESSKDTSSLQKCVKERDYGWCKYVYGEIFNLFPFANILGQVGQNIKKALSHPLEALGVVFSLGCKGVCRTPGAGGLCPGCIALEMLDWLYDLLCDFGVGPNCEPIWDELAVEDSICKEVLKEEEQEEE
ncbi:hypothetical protein CEE44_04155 [Candidatus Woesearchaeota archaeon B3_Woes]|nr:MAG: hypothetical protein CEE44_04155 [Candidatus Woesearchaeota archaeon B3_Woes]